MAETDSDASEDLNGYQQRHSQRQRTGASKETIVLSSDDDATDYAETVGRSQQSIERPAPSLSEKTLPKQKRRKLAFDDFLIESDIEEVAEPARKKKRKTKRRSRDDASDASADDELVAKHVSDRRKKWQRRREKLQADGLLTPPDYDNVDFSDDDRLNRLKERPAFANMKPQRPYEDIELPKSAGVIPAPIAQWLREYQVEGAAFLHEAFVYQKGVILGDDMGLGKTIQVISFLTAAFGKTGDERDSKRMRKKRRAGDGWYPRVLIIAPSSLMANWQGELDRWGWWTSYQYHGPGKEDALEAAASGKLEVMLTTYATYHKDCDLINGIEWDCVIADECHTIKNSKAKIAQAMNHVNALCRIGLTGTAIQNKYEELWTLLNWTTLGQVGTLKAWKSTISKPLQVGQSHEATLAQLALARNTAEDLVQNLLPRFFLRRMKTIIAHQLPKKSDKIVFCPPTALQAQAYNNFCSSDRVQSMVARSGIRAPTKEDTQMLLPVLVTLQKMANHLALLVPSSGENDQEKHDREMEHLKDTLPDQWQRMYAARDSILNFSNQEYCGKWRVLKKMLKIWYDNSDKVLIFSCSVRLLMMLQKLFATTTSYTVSYLDGSTPLDQRQAIVDEYNSSAQQFVFLISTRAGGMGLNITSANKVVVMDPNWNPTYDLQAQDRAYRIGQSRDVDVFRLVTAGTIEENIYARQIYKQQQANIGYNATAERRYFKGVQGDALHRGELFGLANLLRPQTDNMALKDVVNKTNVAETRAGVDIAALDLEASQDMSDDDEEDILESIDNERGMSDLVASILDEPGQRKRKAKQNARKKDPISAVLNAAGVRYTHENAQVIGTSEMETKISSRARRSGNNFEWNQQRAFAETQELDTLQAIDDTSKPVYQYNPPEDVRRRQFCSMAKFMGFNDVCEFALVVEGWSRNQRQDFLTKFYKHRLDVCAADRVASSDSS